jgi:hypothetical protein
MMKKVGQYEGEPPVVAAYSWVKSGTDISTLYTFTPSLNTNELNKALVIGTIKADTANRTTRLALTGWTNGQIAYQLDTGLSWQLIDATQIATDAGWTAAPQYPSLQLITEIEMIVSGNVITLGVLNTTILNDVIKGDEGTPAAIPDLKASDAQAVDSTDTTHWMTPHAVALAIASLLKNLPSSDPHINGLPYLNGDFVTISRG